MTTETVHHYVRLPDVDSKEGPMFSMALADDLKLESWFNKKTAKKSIQGMSVGQVYAIPSLPHATDPDRHTFVFGKRSWVGHYPDTDKITEWQATQKAREVQADVKAREVKEATGTSGLEEVLAPLQKAYAALPYPHRVAFEVWVLSVIRRKP